MNAPTQSPYAGRRFLAALAQYVVGRGLNALLSISLFVAIARLLGVQAYGSYVALIAMLELLIVVGNLGTDWVASVELPRLSQAGAGRSLRRLAGVCMVAQLAGLATLGIVLWLAAPWVVAQLGITGAEPALRVYAWLIVVEGMGRSVRDLFLSSLLMQWMAQLAQILRNAVVFGALLCWVPADGWGLHALSQLELGASVLGLVVGGTYLGWQLYRLPSGPDVALDAAAMRRTARNAWIASLSHQVWSGHAIVLLVTRVLGSEVGGVVGFARNLAEQVRRFMPVEFGFGLIRTFLVTRQGEEGGPALLERVAAFWKLNALVLVPALGLGLLFGPELAGWVSGGQFTAAGLWLPWWLLWVFVWSHHRLSDTLAYLVGTSGSVGRFSLLLLPALGLFMLALVASGLHAAFAVLVLVELSYCVGVVRSATRQAGLTYPLRRLALPALLSSGVVASLLAALPAWLGHAEPWQFRAALLCVAFAALTWLLRPLKFAELRPRSPNAAPVAAA
jgi:O-antigen/teichoic acid export membrane protein